MGSDRNIQQTAQTLEGESMNYVSEHWYICHHLRHFSQYWILYSCYGIFVLLYLKENACKAAVAALLYDKVERLLQVHWHDAGMHVVLQ